MPNEALRPQNTSVRELAIEWQPVAFVANFFNKASGQKPPPWHRLLTARFNLFDMRSNDNLGLDLGFNPLGNQIINYPGRQVSGTALEVRIDHSPFNALFFNLSNVRVTQLGSCLRAQADGVCFKGYEIANADISEFPKQTWVLGASLRPFSLISSMRPLEALQPLGVTALYRHVGPSSNNSRTVFEAMNFPFVHPGYDSVDVGLLYSVPVSKTVALNLQAYVFNLLGADLSEPIVIKLEPRPSEGYFLPRPGRHFRASVELTY